MGDVIERKITAALTTVFGTTVLAAVLLCLCQILSLNSTADINALKIDAQELAVQIESGVYSTDSDLDYAVILNDGNVSYNNGTALHEHVNLHSLGNDSSEFFTMPLIRNSVQYGTLYIDISERYYGHNKADKLRWAVISALIIIAAMTGYIIVLSTVKKDIFVPVQQLHNSTREIMNGQLDKSVKYDYDGETGTLCHDFELMRLEIRDSFNHEQKIKEDEKLLMASISHDLKTPLATVQGYLESICIGVVTDGDEINKYCKNALDKTILLGKMTNDILEHSKAELRQLTVEREEVYTKEFFIEINEELKSDAQSRGYILEYGEIPNIIISLDKTRIAQVMENLVGNSFKYGKSGGKIEISFRDDGRFFYVCVKDDGQGIAAEDLPFVFDRFFRGDKARTQNITGSGLGLSIAKYIVEHHGGRIECDSVLGCYTAVEFCIKE